MSTAMTAATAATAATPTTAATAATATTTAAQPTETDLSRSNAVATTTAAGAATTGAAVPPTREESEAVDGGGRGHLKRKTADSADTATAVPTKRARPRAHIYRPSNMNLLSELVCGTAMKANMVTLVPLTTSQNKAVFLQLDGGGDIPVQFGLGDVPDNPEKFKLSFNIKSDSEYNALCAMREQLSSVAIREWKTWFQSTKASPSDLLLRDLCYSMVTEKKERAGSPGQYYPGLFKATFGLADIDSGRCRILHADTKEPVSFRDLPGMRWVRSIVELRHIFIQGSKSYGITKRLRYIEVVDGYGEEDIVPLDV